MNIEEMIDVLTKMDQPGYSLKEGLALQVNPMHCRAIAAKLQAAEELAMYCRGFDGTTWSTKILELTRAYDRAGLS
jgi:hypothetical protein